MLYYTDSNWLMILETPAGDLVPYPYLSLLENWHGKVKRYDPVQMQESILTPVAGAPAPAPKQYAVVKNEKLLILGKFQSGLYLLKREKTGQFIVAPEQIVTLISPAYSYPKG